MDRATRMALRRYTNRKKQLVAEAKAKAGTCSICGEDDPRCLDFHHVDPSTKEGGLSKLAKGRGYTAIQRELRKCILLCSNCHRKHHAPKTARP